MNIKRAKEEIKNTAAAYLLKDEDGEYAIPSMRQRPVLLIGPPGVGKTQIMEQAARECGIGLVSYTITHHTRQSAVGLPRIETREFDGQEYAVTEYTMSEIVAAVYRKMEETGLKEGILFLDEINCVSETLAPAMLQFLQYKTFGSHKIPDGWIIVAAGNPPEYNKSVREFDIVTLDRMKRMNVEPDYTVWKEYALGKELHPAVLSYLDLKPENFCRIETTVDGKRFATPRGWEDLSDLLKVYERLGKEADREVVAQYIQFPAISKDFANYLKLYEKYQKDYQAEEILQGNWSEALCDQAGRAAFDERLSLVGLLLTKVRGSMRRLEDLEGQLELVMGRLRGIQEAIKEQGAGALRQEMSQMEGELEQKQIQGLLERREKRIQQGALAMLEEIAGGLEKEEIQESWEFVREKFAGLSDGYEEMEKECGRKLERAFDFLEAAFGSGQELVVFVTELNASPACLRFLKEYHCPRYFQYNKSLLFEDQEQQMREQINQLKGNLR
ncbi:MAG: AAA family ATPase [Lachnospiraceae bacterium]|uniref:MoxR family ATPase n=1 Tax=Candidatus Enterocloster excrementigallinarum TaxID=2838558 RepID=A0A9D2TEA5_9FIRM|nr:AAA family ATPase [Lachnospiraceae bacterium]HJC65951.1 MoxR family ATPase [Candidatus Enterocloster excrementigallinarum]